MSELTQFAVSFAQGSSVLSDPALLARADPVLASLQHVGPVGPGDMANIHVFNLIPQADTPDENQLTQALKAQEGVTRVDVQKRRTRAKRDEF